MEVYHPEKKRSQMAIERGAEKFNRKRNRLPVVETEKRYAEKSGDPDNHPVALQDNPTIESGREQGFFERILPTGAENAMSTTELLERLGLSDQRIVRKFISEERAAGAVILSSGAGYFLPDDGEKWRQEAAAFVASINAKGVNTLRAARSAEAFLAKLPGQTEIGGEAGAPEKSGGKL